MGHSQSCDLSEYVLRESCEAEKARLPACDYSNHRSLDEVSRLYTKNEVVADAYTRNDVVAKQYVANSVRDQTYTSKQAKETDYLPRAEVEKGHTRKGYCEYSKYVPASQRDALKTLLRKCNVEKDKAVADGVAAMTCDYAGGLEPTDQVRKVGGRCPPSALCCRDGVGGVDQGNCPAGIQNGFVQDGIRIGYNRPGLCGGPGVALCG